MADEMTFEMRLAQTERDLTRGLREEGSVALDMVANPAAELRALGYDIPVETEADYNAMFATDIKPLLSQIRLAMEQGSDAWPSLKCAACTTLCWAVAAVIAGLSAAALAGLTEGSGVVLALAELVGCSEGVALAFILELSKEIIKGVTAVVKAICGWMGACP